jgi:hypothetical protein
MARQFTYRMWLLEEGIVTRRTTSATAALKWFQARTAEPLTFDSLIEIRLWHPNVINGYWENVADVTVQQGGIKP